MPRSADKLAFALSSTSTLTRQKYQRLFEHLYVSDAASAGWPLDEVATWRREVARLLENLGICDFFYAEDRLSACPPALTRLPEAGLPSAILTGARTPTLLQELRAAVRASEGQVELTVTPQPAFPMLPNRVVVRAVTLDRLRECAAQVSVSVHGVTAHALLGQAVTLDAYLRDRRREPATELAGWSREDFDPTAVHWSTPTVARVRLTMYKHPQKRGREFYLVDGGEMQNVDPAWGRYAILAHAGKSVLGYDAAEGVLIVPAGARLPAIFERGLTLLSGIAPQPIKHEDAFSHAFVRVSGRDAAVVAEKLRQHLSPITCPATVRNL